MAISKASKGDDSPTNSSSFHWRRREVVIISRAPGIWWFSGNIGYQGQDAIFGAVYAHKGRTKKFKRHGLHGFALDQPSINGIGPIII